MNVLWCSKIFQAPSGKAGSTSSFLSDPEVRYCALIFRDVDNCSSVLVFQVTRMERNLISREKVAGTPTHSFPNIHTPFLLLPPTQGARAHLYSHVQIWMLQADNCPWQALWGQRKGERKQLEEKIWVCCLFSSPAPVPRICVSWPTTNRILLLLYSPFLLALVLLSLLPLLTPPAPLALPLPSSGWETPQLPRQQQPPPRTVRVIITPPTPGPEAEVAPRPGDEGIMSVAWLAEGREEWGGLKSSFLRAGLQCASALERSLGDWLDGRPRATF